MLCRVVSLLLLPCLLLTQSVAVFGHAHGGGQPAGHDLRPHLHSNLVAVASHDAHGHGHVGQHHHHDDANDTLEPDTQPTPPAVPPSDHDTDAVYVTATDAVVAERSGLTTQVESAGWLSFPDSAPFAACHAAPPVRPVVCGRPPPSQLCPLYIRHLALII